MFPSSLLSAFGISSTESPTFTGTLTGPSPSRLGTATTGTIGGPGQGGGYSYAPTLTVSGGALIDSASGETLIKNTIPGWVHSSATLCRNNVLAIQNTGTTDTGRPLPSAIRFLDPAGGERGAIGWSHDTVWAPFARTLFISASQPYTEGYAPAAPPRLRLLQEGLYLGVERFAGRLEFNPDWGIRFLTPLEAPMLSFTDTGAATFHSTLAVTGALTAPTATAGTDSTQVATCAHVIRAMLDPGLVDFTCYTGWTIASSGAGVANAQSAVNLRLTGPTTAVGYITARAAFAASPIWTKSTTSGNGYTFSAATMVSARVLVEARDPNSVWRMSFGKNFASANGALVAKGFGVRCAASGALYLVVHDGAVLTEVASAYVPDTATPFDIRLETNGAGVVTLFVNNAQVATTALGPVGTGLATPGLWMEVENTGIVATQPATTWARPKIWCAN